MEIEAVRRLLAFYADFRCSNHHFSGLHKNCVETVLRQDTVSRLDATDVVSNNIHTVITSPLQQQDFLAANGSYLHTSC